MNKLEKLIVVSYLPTGTILGFALGTQTLSWLFWGTIVYLFISAIYLLRKILITEESTAKTQ